MHSLHVLLVSLISLMTDCFINLYACDFILLFSSLHGGIGGRVNTP